MAQEITVTLDAPASITVEVEGGQGLRGVPGINAAEKWGQVASNCFWPTGLAPDITSQNARNPHVAGANIRSLIAAFANCYGAEVAVPASAAITASIEYPQGVFHQMRFDGSVTGTIPAGGEIECDELIVEIPAGATFYTRIHLVCAGGIVSRAFREQIAGSGSEANAFPGAPNVADKTMGGTIPEGDAAFDYYYRYAPTRILAQTTCESVAIIGDNRELAERFSQLEQSIRNLMPSCQMAWLGSTADGWDTSPNTALRRATLKYFTAIVSNLGINDLVGGRTAAQIIAGQQAIQQINSAARFYVSTLSPHTTSSNGWVDLAGQTILTTNPERVAYNDLLRAEGSGFSGYFEVADLVESAHNSGKWKALYTNDGYSESAVGIAAIRASGVVNVGELRFGRFRRYARDAAASDIAAAQAAAQLYADNLLAVQDAMVFKGFINCSANPNYPAADCGWTYRVSVAGKIGGASGPNVEFGDLLTCLADGTVGGNHATVGASWAITQVNLDGAVIGPVGASDSAFPQFDGTTGRLLKGGIVLAANQFIARSSAGAAAAKTASDDALTLIAAADFSAMRTALSVRRYYGSITFAAMLVLTGMAAGDFVRVSDLGGSEWVYTGTKWHPPAGVLLYNQQGSIFAPIATLSGVTSGQFSLPGGNPVFPAGLIKVGSVITPVAVFYRRGTAATAVINLRLGTLGTTADNDCWTVTTSTSNAVGHLANPRIGVATGTRYNTTRSAVWGGTSSAFIVDRSTNFNVASDNFLSADVSAGNVADSYDLLSLMVMIDP